MKFSCAIAIIMCLFLFACQHPEKNVTTDGTKVSPSVEEMNSLTFDETPGHLRATLGRLTNSQNDGVYFSITRNNDTVSTHFLNNQFHYVSILHSLEHRLINKNDYVYFSLWRKEQGSGAGLLSTISMYLYNVQADSLLTLNYEGIDVDENHTVAGQLKNGEVTPHNEAIATFLLEKMYTDNHFACISPWPFNGYITNWYYDDSRFCWEMNAEHPLTKDPTELVFQTENFSLAEIEGEWLEIVRSPVNDYTFSFAGRDCGNQEPEEKGILISAAGLTIIDAKASVFMHTKVLRKTFHLIAGEISYELEYFSADSSLYEIQLYPVGFNMRMEPQVEAIKKYYSPDQLVDVYIVPKRLRSSFEIKTGDCDPR
jgi:hypothetical protein